MTQTNQLCTFHVGDLFLGVSVLSVQEVLRSQEMTRVPIAPPSVVGLINLRGQIVTALDMRRRLRLPERPSDRLPMNVVIRVGEGAISLLVDEIGDVIEVDEGAFEQPPETLDAHSRELIQAVYKLQGRLLLVLDTQKAAHLAAEAA